MLKKFLLLVLIVLLSISLVITGCKSQELIQDGNSADEEQIDDEQKNEQQGKVEGNREGKKEDKTEENKEEDKEDKEEDKEENETITYEHINTNINNDEKVKELLWSKDYLKVAFIKELENESKLYLWTVGEKEAIMLEDISGNLYDLKWCQNEYVIVNEGTWVLADTYIITSEDKKVVDVITNVATPVVSPHNKQIAFAVTNNKKPTVDIDLGSTTDIMIYDIETRAKKIVLLGKEYFILSPISWSEDGLLYVRDYFDGLGDYYDDYKDDERILNNILIEKMLNSNYNIATSMKIKKTDTLTIEIYWPVISNSNKRGEEEINIYIREMQGGLNSFDEIESTTIIDYDITKSTDEIFSMVSYSSIMLTGAAHPSRYISSVTFNLNTGKRLQLGDLFKVDSNYIAILNNILSEKVKELNLDTIKEFKGLEENNGFYIKDDSLVIYYQEGVYTPHTYGPLFIEIKNSELKGVLK